MYTKKSVVLMVVVVVVDVVFLRSTLKTRLGISRPNSEFHDHQLHTFRRSASIDPIQHRGFTKDRSYGIIATTDWWRYEEATKVSRARPLCHARSRYSLRMCACSSGS